MEQITIGQIGIAVATIVALISGIRYLVKAIQKWLTKLLDAQFQEIRDKMDNLQKQMAEVDMESCKNYLVEFLANVEKGSIIDEIQKERFWEQFEHYSSIGGNSYIQNKIDELKSKNYL